MIKKLSSNMYTVGRPHNYNKTKIKEKFFIAAVLVWSVRTNAIKLQ